MAVSPAVLLERGPGVAEDDVTLGELSRNITAMRGDFDRRFMEMNSRLDNLQFVSRDTYTAEMNAVKKDVEELKESKQWMSRVLVGSLVLPVVVAFVVTWVVTR